MRSRWVAGLFAVVSLACGGGTGNDAGMGSDGAVDMDGMVANACVGMADGIACGEGRICVGGLCLQSRCGDGVLNTTAGEECDDGNIVAFDGCEIDCTLTCANDARCSDGEACNGAEICDPVGHICGPAAANLADGTACTAIGITDGVCRAGACVNSGCGNGVPDGSEDCDDGNAADDDGCNNDCTFSCTTATVTERCDDLDACTGTETCDESSHTCVAGLEVSCLDSSACTADTCDPATGSCVFTLIDPDGDGEAATSLGSCGTDCNDADMTICRTCPEQCDAIDQDCDGNPMPATTPIWYRDCDADGMAGAGAVTTLFCGAGTPPAVSGCTWTLTPNTVPNVDCNDSDADAHPGQTGWFATGMPGVPAATNFDYDCSGVEEQQITGVSASPLCLISGRPPFQFCRGIGTGWQSATAPACGASGNYVTCGATSTSSCGQVVQTRQQLCH